VPVRRRSLRPHTVAVANDFDGDTSENSFSDSAESSEPDGSDADTNVEGEPECACCGLQGTGDNPVVMYTETTFVTLKSHLEWWRQALSEECSVCDPVVQPASGVFMVHPLLAKVPATIHAGFDLSAFCETIGAHIACKRALARRRVKCMCPTTTEPPTLPAETLHQAPEEAAARRLCCSRG
jgi:hypothetical protein